VALNPTSSRGGGGGTATLTATLTTDEDTFVSPIHVFDFGSEGPHLAQVKMTAVTLVADGETFGNDPGTIYAGSDFVFDTSYDGTAWVAATKTTLVIGPQTGGGGTPTFEIQSQSSVAAAVLLAGRYFRVQLSIVSNDTGEIYAGSNHPQAVVAFHLRYT
jgi:hypothetical protein